VIAVVADDFTGAAEIGGVGLRYGLKAEVQTEVNPDSRADILVIDTDTRSRTPQEAATQVEKVLKQLQKIHSEWIYKKVDSVLRGPVMAELQAVFTALGKDRIILVPANPSLGRQIRRGHYFVHGKPIDKTEFANDPEHPATSSDVLELLGPSRSITTRVLERPQSVPAQVIAVGQAQTKDDLLAWAARLNTQTIPAGAAEFFAAILEVKGFCETSPESREDLLQRKTALFVCTSTSPSSQKVVEQAHNCGLPVSVMLLQLLQSDDLTDELVQQWTDDTITAFEKHPRVIATIRQHIGRPPPLARKLRHYIAALVENVLNHTSIDALYIEGGATASAVVRRLRWKRFFPCRELAPSVVRMRVGEKRRRYLTVKPGSYPWPEKIWSLP